MISLTVQGMNCGSCARAITRVVHELDADAKVVVELATKKVTIEADELTAEQIIPVLNEAGYRASLGPVCTTAR